MNQGKKTYNNKIELALSALMFFWPLIQNIVKKNKYLSNWDIQFISWFIKLWYFNIILLAISIFTQICFYITRISLLQNASFIIGIILWISLITWSIFAILNKNILQNNDEENITEKEVDLLTNILYYIPIYNIYIWYKKHNFENPELMIKESIILWTIFTVSMLIFKWNSTILLIIIIFIIRIISITTGIYLADKQWKIINNLFKKNPEEIWSYISWTIKTIFNSKTINENITTTKQKFELIPKLEYRQILLQYIILTMIIWFLVYTGYSSRNLNLIISCWLIIGRYLIMIIKRRHVPNLPIIKEFVDLFFKNKL